MGFDFLYCVYIQIKKMKEMLLQGIPTCMPKQKGKENTGKK